MTGLRWARRAGELEVVWELVNPGAADGLRRTDSFAVSDRRLVHRLPAGRIDNDLGDLIASELVRPGLADDFEALFAGTAADPFDAWDRFYGQTLAGLGGRSGSGAVATFGQIYRHALGLVDGGSLLDAGSCFGFFCLLAAERGLQSVRGSDVCPATVALADRIARRRGIAVRFERADVREPLPGRADTVTAQHLLEHLDRDELPRALESLCGAARRRVVVAVPLEHAPDPTYGHRSAFSMAGLTELATSAPGWDAEVHEYHGGWLVLDRRSAAPRDVVDTLF